MDIITEKAKRFIEDHFSSNMINSEPTFQAASDEIEVFHSKLDKIKFLNLVLNAANDCKTQHDLLCKMPTECGQDYEHANLAFLLTQDLNKLGVLFDENTFTQEEKNNAEAKLDQIIKDLENLKMGQEVLLEDLNELRDLYFLGKKSWHQLLVGKVVEMAAGGVVSEVFSKQLIEDITKLWPTLQIKD